MPRHAERALATIVDDVIAGFAAECRLCGVTVRADVASGLSSSGLDDAQLTAGLAGALMATLPLVQHAVRPTVSLRASGTDTAGVVLEVIQRDVAVPLAPPNHQKNAVLALLSSPCRRGRARSMPASRRAKSSPPRL